MTRYYRVVLRYGHVGLKREVAVARYLEIREPHCIIDIYEMASSMPGVKSHGVIKIETVDKETYEIGITSELENFYLQKLMKHRARGLSA